MHIDLTTEETVPWPSGSVYTGGGGVQYRGYKCPNAHYVLKWDFTYDEVP